ncbi:hypothetical protein GCM10025870_08230 [Agromyces marinus]|uniref:Glycosyltransferase n=2 Tax=Agromyces marinus TaxID=1389020 RepID=A0ABM8GZ31_9MICO|nr:glycosyltransferase [Agromyces marinus]BDZ53750.1 hypothetical protein GCM10025870_08230 [Agromyces marinus]
MTEPGAERYDLVICNEVEMLPWCLEHLDDLLAPGGRLHVDLHEFAPSQNTGAIHSLLFKRFRLWLASFVGDSRIGSRTVVSPGIAGLYSEYADVEAPTVIRNTVAFAEGTPSPVDPGRIKLIYHGVAARARGLDLLIDAMHEVESRFTLELMLIGPAETIKALKGKAAPLGSRVGFRDPVPMEQLPEVLNAYDLEVIFYPPIAENLRFALPNKFFEALQARVGVIVGDSPDMVSLVRAHGNGEVVTGWTAADLARGINAMDADRVREIKAATDAAARELSAEHEGSRFLEAVGASSAESDSRA